jgi:shikimate kinase
VIGVAGTGKSFLVKEMTRKGFDAVDLDIGFTAFVNKKGIEVDYNPKGGSDWWKSHYYVLKLGKLERLIERRKSIFVFGDVGGQPGRSNGLLDVTQLFDRVCYLRAPPATIRERLAKRTDNPFGKNPEEIKGTMRHKARMDRIARKLKFEIVDVSLGTEGVIQSIVGMGYQGPC